MKGLAPILQKQMGPNVYIKSFALSGADASHIKSRLPFIVRNLNGLPNNEYQGSQKEFEFEFE